LSSSDATPDTPERARTAVHALTPQGARLARALAAELDADVHLPRKLAAPGEAAFDSLPVNVAEVFHRYAAHVFVAACGIVVRAVAPHLKGKTVDPAVVVLDQNGRHAVSLLSGHLGGANDLARRAAAFTGGEAVITTGTDSAGLPSLDMMARDAGLALENPQAIKTANAALLDGSGVQLFDPESRLPVPPEAGGLFQWVSAPHHLDPARASVAVAWRTTTLPPGCLILRPRVVVAGVGCRKGAPAADILALIRRALAMKSVSPLSLTALASIEAKRHEPGLAEAARELKAELVFYPPEQLAAMNVPNPSAMALKHMGVTSVCEAAALLASGSDKLLLPKTKTGTVTVALALAG